MRIRSWATVSMILLAAGCYHATIETGAVPSTVVVEENFASGWIAGLIPPSTVDVASKCSNGVAKVETQHSFVNMLVQFITFNIYTPMTIKVTCAQAGRRSAFHVPANAGPDQQVAVMSAAAERSARSGEPVFVSWGER